MGDLFESCKMETTCFYFKDHILILFREEELRYCVINDDMKCRIREQDLEITISGKSLQEKGCRLHKSCSEYNP
jgi:hypothetical protein